MIIALQPKTEVKDTKELQRFIKSGCAKARHPLQHLHQLSSSLPDGFFTVAICKPQNGADYPFSIFVCHIAKRKKSCADNPLVVRGKI